jgi:hypothetical protein
MISETMIGSVGVGLLLVAFFLNLFGVLKATSRIYILLNVLGGYLSCYASVLIGYMPFVILEGTWALVALVKFVMSFKDGGRIC